MSICPSVPLFFCVFFYVLLLPFTKANLIGQLQKNSLGEIDLRFTILAQKWSKIAAQNFFGFVSLCHSLLMSLGHNQQQHLTVHSGGVSRVLPFPFRFLWTLLMNTFCGHFFLKLYIVNLIKTMQKKEDTTGLLHIIAKFTHL